MATEYVPDVGDVIWLDMNPRVGHEQSGRRPALVLTSAIYNGKTGMAVACPITNQEKGFPFEVPLYGFTSNTTGVVLSDQLRAFDWKIRQAEYKDKADETIVTWVKDKIATLLEMDF